MTSPEPSNSDAVVPGQPAELPLEPDAIEAGLAGAGSATRPVHLQPRLLLAAFAGGLLGTPARYALELALPTSPGAWPTGTFLTNLVGAFCLGALLEGLVRRGPDTGRRRLLRLGLGTGVLGAFTTYSTLAIETDLLIRAHRPGLAAAYALSSVLAGLLLTAAGLKAAAAHHRRSTPPSPTTPTQ